MNKLIDEKEIKRLLKKASCIEPYCSDRFGHSLIENIIASIPNTILNNLETAQEHYAIVIGLISNYLFDEDMLNKNRGKYTDFMKKSDDELIVFDIANCSLFMSQEYNLPYGLCWLYVEHKNDF